MKNPKPEPVVVKQECSLCGQDWEGHCAEGEQPTVLDCIRVLRFELARRPIQTWANSGSATITMLPSVWGDNVARAQQQAAKRQAATGEDEPPEAVPA